MSKISILCCIACVQSDVILNTRKIGAFHTQSDEMSQSPLSPSPLIMHDRVVVILVLFVHLLNLYKLGPLAIMHGNCLIDGLRVKSFSPLNLCGNKKGKQYKKPVRIHCFALFCSLLQHESVNQQWLFGCRIERVHAYLSLPGAK